MNVEIHLKTLQQKKPQPKYDYKRITHVTHRFFVVVQTIKSLLSKCFLRTTKTSTLLLCMLGTCIQNLLALALAFNSPNPGEDGSPLTIMSCWYWAMASSVVMPSANPSSAARRASSALWQPGGVQPTPLLQFRSAL